MSRGPKYFSKIFVPGGRTVRRKHVQQSWLRNAQLSDRKWWCSWRIVSGELLTRVSTRKSSRSKLTLQCLFGEFTLAFFPLRFIRSVCVTVGHESWTGRPGGGSFPHNCSVCRSWEQGERCHRGWFILRAYTDWATTNIDYIVFPQQKQFYVHTAPVLLCMNGYCLTRGLVPVYTLNTKTSHSRLTKPQTLKLNWGSALQNLPKLLWLAEVQEYLMNWDQTLPIMTLAKFTSDGKEMVVASTLPIISCLVNIIYLYIRLE